MGACCSCHKGIRLENNFFNGEDEEREPEIEDIVLRGDSGARIQLQGSSKHVSMFSKQGKKGHNQDAMTVWEVTNNFLHNYHLYHFYIIHLL